MDRQAATIYDCREQGLGGLYMIVESRDWGGVSKLRRAGGAKGGVQGV